MVHTKSGRFVKLPRDLWSVIGLAMIEKIGAQGHSVLAVSVDTHHAHPLVELPGDRAAVKRTVGTWKQRASHKVRDRLPGEIWSKSCDPVRVESRSHHQRVYRYILDHANDGAWVWSFKDDGEP